MSDMTVNEAGMKGGSSKSPAKRKSARVNGLMGGRPMVARLNKDGISVKGCSYIYAPSGQAAEYAVLATNPYRGCGHKCSYCYVPKILRMKRPEFNSSANPRPRYLENLVRNAKKYELLGISEQVMLSFTTDPYHPFDTSLTRDTLLVLRDHGLAFSTLTKGGTRALRDLDLFRPEWDSFACTLTSLDNGFSRKWEPGAALPEDRLDSLRSFHEAGIFTWVSLEPTLDTESSLNIVKVTHKFVDLYKIGRANYLPMTETTDWESYTHSMIKLLDRLGKAHYIKHDLQPYLPDGYVNPLRVAQHRSYFLSGS
jgi:hypothetical protein